MWRVRPVARGLAWWWWPACAGPASSSSWRLPSGCSRGRGRGCVLRYAGKPFPHLSQSLAVWAEVPCRHPRVGKQRASGHQHPHTLVNAHMRDLCASTCSASRPACALMLHTSHTFSRAFTPHRRTHRMCQHMHTSPRPGCSTQPGLRRHTRWHTLPCGPAAARGSLPFHAHASCGRLPLVSPARAPGSLAESSSSTPPTPHSCPLRKA